MKKLLLAGACALAMGITSLGNAAEVTSIKKGYALKLEGIIVEGDDHRIHDAYQASCAVFKRCPERIFLSSDGGQMGAAVDAADIVRELGLDTVVDKEVTCASACFMIFASGKHRVARDGAYIGVHQVRDADTGEVNKEAQIYYEGVMRGWRVPTRVINKFSVTNPANMGWLEYTDVGEWIEIIN